MKMLLCEECLKPKGRDHVHEWAVTSGELADLTWWVAQRVIAYLNLEDPDTDQCDLFTEVAGEIQAELETCFAHVARRRDREHIHQRILAAAVQS